MDSSYDGFLHRAARVNFVVRSTVVILREESWLLWIARTTEAARVGTTRWVAVQGCATLAARWCLPKVKWILRNPVVLSTPLTRSMNFPSTEDAPKVKAQHSYKI